MHIDLIMRYYTAIRLAKSGQCQVLTKMKRDRKPHSLMIGVQIRVALLEINVALIVQTKHTCTCDPATLLLGYMNPSLPILQINR